MELSVVIPAYNEAGRLPRYLDAIRAYGDDVWGASNYEMIVVDDGSTDELAEVLAHRLTATQRGARTASDRNVQPTCSMPWPELRLIRHETNQGKGAAVRTGMLAARGKRLLFADADGATPIAEEAKLRQALEAGADVSVGSRWLCHRSPNFQTPRDGPGDPSYVCDSAVGRVSRPVRVERTRCRQWAGRLFAWAARNALGLDVRDTQCGFKMFTRAAGLSLFQLCRENGYLFDLEILFWAQWSGYRVAEVPVTWIEVAGSKLRFWRDGWRMATGLFRLRRSLRQRSGGPLTPNPSPRGGEGRTKDVGGDIRLDEALGPMAGHPRHRRSGVRAALVAAGIADPHLG